MVSLEGKIYSCKHCRTHLALSEDIVSKVVFLFLNPCPVGLLFQSCEIFCWVLLILFVLSSFCWVLILRVLLMMGRRAIRGSEN